MNNSIKRTIILPELDNDKVSLAHERNTILLALLEVVGGYSLVELNGYWRNELGQVFHDKSVEVTVIYDDTAIDAWLVEQLPLWCGLLRQQCLLTATSTIDAVFVESYTTIADVAA